MLEAFGIGLWSNTHFGRFKGSFDYNYTHWEIQSLVLITVARFGCFHERASRVFGRLRLCGVFAPALYIVLLTNNHCHTSLDSNRQPLGGVARVRTFCRLQHESRLKPTAVAHSGNLGGQRSAKP